MLDCGQCPRRGAGRRFDADQSSAQNALALGVDVVELATPTAHPSAAEDQQHEHHRQRDQQEQDVHQRASARPRQPRRVEHHHQRAGGHAQARQPGRQPAGDRERHADARCSRPPSRGSGAPRAACAAPARWPAATAASAPPSTTKSARACASGTALPEGDGDVGARQHRAVVQAVAHHRDAPAARLQRCTTVAACPPACSRPGAARCRRARASRAHGARRGRRTAAAAAGPAPAARPRRRRASARRSSSSTKLASQPCVVAQVHLRGVDRQRRRRRRRRPSPAAARAAAVRLAVAHARPSTPCPRARSSCSTVQAAARELRAPAPRRARAPPDAATARQRRRQLPAHRRAQALRGSRRGRRRGMRRAVSVPVLSNTTVSTRGQRLQRLQAGAPGRRGGPARRRSPASPPAWPATARRGRSRSAPRPRPSAPVPGSDRPPAAQRPAPPRPAPPAGRARRRGRPAARAAACRSEALSISATICAKRVSCAERFDPHLHRADQVVAAGQHARRRRRAARGAIRRSAAPRRPCVSPSSTLPSAGKTSPGSTRTTSPTASRRTGDALEAAVGADAARTLSGSRRISASSAPAVRSRRRCLQPAAGTAGRTRTW